MFLHDWFDWSNAGVGVAGLALTVGALAQATGAKRAARQAREAIGHGNAADSLSEMVRFAEQLATWVQCERRAEAIVQVREIVLRIARDRGEFDRFLASDADKLRNWSRAASVLPISSYGGEETMGEVEPLLRKIG